MDSLNSSVSFPNALNSAKPPKGSTISASCSFRSHLSTANSQKRLRAASYVAPSSEERSPSDVDLETSHSAPSSSFSLPALVSEFVPFSRQSQDGHVSWTARTFKWLAVTFCLLSVLVMTSHLVAARSRRTVTTQLLAPVVGVQNPLPSSLISSIVPPPRALVPFVLRGEPTTLCACLWCLEEDLEDLVTWASRWRGSISLMVVASSPLSPRQTLDKIRATGNRLSRQASLSLHLVHIDNVTQASPNAYLNLARLFSPSRQVVLFPGQLSLLPPPMSSLLASKTSTRPVLLTSISSTRGPTTFPFHPPLTPVLLDRDYTLWASERVFFSTSRSQNWEEFLWQLWIDSFGELGSLVVPGLHQLDGESNAVDVPHHRAKLHQRLSFRYRSDICDLTAKQHDAMGGSKRKLRWLTKFCRDTIAAKGRRELPVPEGV